jgi:predicted amidohydrolase
MSICYDLRFPELYRALVDAQARWLFVPSAFTRATGKDHWEVLLRARAIESQCYVVAPGVVRKLMETVKAVAEYDRGGNLYVGEVILESFRRQGADQ